MTFLSKILGDSNQKYIKKIEPLVEKINALEADFSVLSDDDLKGKTAEFKNRLEKGENLDDILPEAFAAVREAAKRTLGQRHYDVQLIGGIILHQGKIAEMKTGEGKTLVATLPAYLNALSGEGAHIVTVNDYLSRRDAVWMGQIYNFLGLSVGCINHDSSYLYDSFHFKKDEYKDKENGISNFQFPVSKQISNSKQENFKNDELDKERDIVGGFKVIHEFLKPVSRREAYEADILYGTNNEFGFDYLRDNLVYNENQMAQREHSFAIVDEVDSILIDEARTPLIISAPDTESGDLYKVFSRLVPKLKEGDDYTIDEKMRAVSLNDNGIEKMEKLLGIQNIYTEKGIKYAHHLEQALKAEALFKRDKDYVVKSGEVIIVDEFTGRLMPGRRWSEGLHQAVEAKEGVEVKKESRTVATITFQNYFRMYKKLAGMTGTALTSSEEFEKVYNLEVVPIPTNKPLVRKDLNDKIFQTENGKFMAAAKQIKECAEQGQPVLVGTISIEKNEFLSALLSREGVPHKVLNAKNHEKEAEIIAQAGKSGAVTIATNMAGRGVDIMLGGNPFDEKEAEKARDAGGLFVLGTERHEARRIDNQLRGRAGRQGDPGATQFFVSLSDDLLRIFASDKLKGMIGRFGIPEDEPIENSLVSKAIESAQAKIEGFNFDARKYTLEYDNVMNMHRKKIYETRKKILTGGPEAVFEEFKNISYEELNAVINIYTHGDKDSWLSDEFISVLEGKLVLSREKIENIKNIIKEDGNEDNVREKIRDAALHTFQEIYETKKEEFGNNFYDLLRNLILQITDMFWMEHLETMEYMKASVRLRAYGQRDPLVEYKNEAVRMFRDLERAIKANVFFSFLSTFAKISKSGEQTHSHSATFNTPKENYASENSMSTSAPQKNIGRNDPCPCGSGKKYKRCHGA